MRVDTIFRNLTYRWGVVLKRWLKTVDIALLKEKGNYRVQRFRTICLIKGDHQFDAKRLGRTTMCKGEMGGTNTFIADKQYGSRKNHRAIEVVINSRLVDDLLRAHRQPGIICSNDLQSC